MVRQIKLKMKYNMVMINVLLGKEKSAYQPAANPSQVYPQHYVHQYPFVHLAAERHWTVKCLAQEHNTMSPARARTRTARSGIECTNHEATPPPIWQMYTDVTQANKC